VGVEKGREKKEFKLNYLRQRLTEPQSGYFSLFKREQTFVHLLPKNNKIYSRHTIFSKLPPDTNRTRNSRDYFKDAYVRIFSFRGVLSLFYPGLTDIFAGSRIPLQNIKLSNL